MRKEKKKLGIVRGRGGATKQATAINNAWCVVGCGVGMREDDKRNVCVWKNKKGEITMTKKQALLKYRDVQAKVKKGVLLCFGARMCEKTKNWASGRKRR